MRVSIPGNTNNTNYWGHMSGNTTKVIKVTLSGNTNIHY